MLKKDVKRGAQVKGKDGDFDGVVGFVLPVAAVSVIECSENGADKAVDDNNLLEHNQRKRWQISHLVRS